MSHPLQQQLDALSHRARKLVFLHGAARLAAIVIGVLLLLGLVDYLLRPADQALRFVALATVIGVAAWCVLRYLQPAWRYRPAAVDMARRLEQRFPQLGQRLSSSAAFLTRGNEQLPSGSLQLQRILIAETTATMETLPVAEVFNLAPVVKSLAAFLAVGLVGGVLIVLDPASASVAARRLLVPWSETPWPRRNYLVLIDPPGSIARGNALEVSARDANGRRLDDVELQWRTADDAFGSRQARAMKPLGDHYEVRLENIASALEFRVVGGDDHTMRWHHVEVVDPPELKTLAIEVAPPEYIGQGVYVAPPDARVLAGSRLVLRGTADRPLQRAELLPPGDSAEPIEGQLQADSFSFTLPANKPWVPEQGGEYAVRLFETGQQEVAATFRYALEVVSDRPPQATFGGTPPATAAATAVLPLAIELDDDLGVASARLMIRRASDDGREPVAVELYRAPTAAADAPSPGKGEFLSEPWRERFRYEWSLAETLARELGPLEPGDELIYYLEAVDALGQVGRGSERRLSIISLEEFNRRMGRRLSEIEAKLAEALRIESELVGGTGQIQLQLDQVGTAGAGDLDQLQSIELRQRQVESLLVSRPDSAAALVRDTLAEIDQNRLELSTTRERLEEYRAAISRLAQTELPAAARELIAALKQLRADLKLGQAADPAERIELSNASRQSLTAALTSAGMAEQAVVAALEELLGSLARWSDYHRFSEELSEIRRQQESLMADTAAMRPETIGRERRDMPAQIAAELDKLALRQRELARRFEQLQGQLEATARQLDSSDGATAARLREVYDESSRRGVAGKLRDSGNHLDANRLGVAGNTQQQVIDDLEQLLNMLSGRRETDLNKIADMLRDEAGKLANMQQRAEDLEQQAAAAKQDSDEKNREQQLDQLNQEKKELADEIERSRRRLERLEALPAAEEAAAARDALNDGQNEDPDAAGLEKQAASAKERLKNARDRLEEKLRQTQQDLFHEQIARLEQALAGLKLREQAVLAEIDRLQALRDQQGELTPGERASVASLAAEQRIVQQETALAAAGIENAAVFQLSLGGIARAMGRVADGLEAEQTDPAVRSAAEEAIARLDQLIAALKPEPPPPSDNNNAAGGDPQPPPPADQPPPVDGVKLMAEVKLLKLMQLEINRRTREIEQSRGETGDLNDAQQSELKALADEQGRLAELFAKIVESLQAAPDGENESADRPADPMPPPPTQEKTEELEKELDELLDDLG